MTSSTVRVALRIRPLSPQEHANGETECVTQLPGVPQIVIGADRAFTFDYVFSPEVSQEQVYDDSIAPLVGQFLQGYNATVLAYGQTGSGKTFSMGTGLTISVTQPELQGVVPRAIGAIWSNLEAKSKRQPTFTYSLDVSFLELYNEDLVDLLNPRSPTAGNGGGRGPTIREDSRGNMVLVGVERKPAAGEDDIITYLHQGALSRTTASTDMNHTSSRSHAIFTIHLTQQDRRSSLLLSSVSPTSLEPSELDSGMSIVSKIHFVDLAGSERIKRTGAAGDRAKEGISINAGLLALGNVISALGGATTATSGSSNPSGGLVHTSRRGTVHVPYRDSKLTRLLQDSLGGNSQTLMLACISPSDRNSPESLNTIRYANRARNIRNKVAVNFDKNSSVELSMLKTEVARLRGELSKLKLLRRQSTLTLNGTPAELNGDAAHSVSVVMRKNADLTLRLEQALRRAAALENERNLLRLRVAELGGSNQPTPNILPASLPHFNAPAAASSEDNELAEAIDVMSHSNVLSTMDRELSEQAERHEHQIDSVRRHFTSRLELVQESLVVVQKERDVALQRLANANLSTKSELRAGSAAATATPTGRGSSTTPPNRRTLGIDVASGGANAVTPTKLRLPSRNAKGILHHDLSSPSAPISRVSSSAELRCNNSGGHGAVRPLAQQLTRMGSSSHIGASALGLQEDASSHIRRMQDEIDRLKRENKRVVDNSSSECEQLTLQIQEQAKEISRLRRQHTGRRESSRFSLLSCTENSWGAAKSAAAAGSSSTATAATTTSQHHHQQLNGDSDPHSSSRDRQDGAGPNLLRAAYIKAVVENELQRCVRARQLLRERDSFLAEQDQLMNQQNDLLLSMQNLQQDSEVAMASDEDDTTGSDEYKSMQMQRVSEKIEIIDAELHHLDLKVRDAEAEVAQLAEAASATDDASSLDASGLLAAPAIINMSGLAMRMVEDVVRVDYRAFDDLFQSLPQPDSTGLAYLLMQDIIEHRLVALRDARERASLEDQAMDLRRTLLAMQKTALNAALSYERELGDAERKLDLLLPPHLSSAVHQLSRRGSTAPTGSNANDGLNSIFDKSGEEAVAATVSACEAVVPDRAIYEGVRERGILLRSALISALEAPAPGSEVSVSASRISRADGWDGGASSADNMSMENIRGAKAHVAEWSEGASDFDSASDDIGDNDNNSVSDSASLLPYDSIHSKLSPVDPTRVNPFAEHCTAREGSLPSSSDAAPTALGDLAHVNSSSEDTTTHVFADASDVFEPLPDSNAAMQPASRAALPPRSRLNMASSPVESDTSHVGDPHGLGTQPTPAPTDATTRTVTVVDTQPVDSEDGRECQTDSDDSGLEEGNLQELYQPGSGGDFQLLNLARNQSARNRRRSSHLVHQTSTRKKATGFRLAGFRPARSGSIGRRRGSLRKARISLPIVPPEMIEFVNKRNPTAISVGSAPPIVASPEMLRAMRIAPGGEYQGNIAAFASFAVTHATANASNNLGPPIPPRRQSISNSAMELPLASMAASAAQARSPADSCQTQISSPASNASPQVYIPRSAGKILSHVDVGRMSPSSPSPYVRSNKIGSPAASMLWSPVTIGGAPSMLESTDNTLLPSAHSTPQHQRSPASVDRTRLFNGSGTQHARHKSAASAMSSSIRSDDAFSNAGHDASASCANPARSSGVQRMRADSLDDYAVREQPCTSPNRLRREISKALVQPLPGQAMLSDHSGSRRPYSDTPDSSAMTRPAFATAMPRPHSDLGSSAAVVDVEKPQRFLSPTELANASLFSMLEAAHAEIGNGESTISDNEEVPHNYQLAHRAAGESKLDWPKDLAVDKPARIRRRAQTTNSSSDASRKPNNYRAASRLSTHGGMEKVAGGGVSRLSKILGGFGLGGSKSKLPPQPSFILHDYYKAGPDLAGYGGMASAKDFGRDRSSSDLTEARVAHVRKVHSALDRVSAGSSHNDWSSSAMTSGDGNSSGQQRSVISQPSIPSVDKAVTATSRK